MTEIAPFLLLEIWSCQILVIGNKSMTKSIMTFSEAEAMTVACTLRQVPGTFGFQIFSRGVHWKIRRKKQIV